MADNIDELIFLFSKKTQLKGSDNFQKIQQLSSRWAKVIEDCEKTEDKSVYRTNFANSHREPLDLINSSKDSFSLEELVSNLIVKLKNSNTPGEIDALAFIISELKSCL